eukprot:m.308842 g.308842  ORF g.308842 m.308842 type:complete len:1044 (+) comp44959_c0_seq1:1986-5117(+)
MSGGKLASAGDVDDGPRIGTPARAKALEEAFHCRYRIGDQRWKDCTHAPCREIGSQLSHYIGCPVRKSRLSTQFHCRDCHQLLSVLFEHASACKVPTYCPVFKCSKAKQCIASRSPYSSMKLKRALGGPDSLPVLPNESTPSTQSMESLLCTWPVDVRQSMKEMKLPALSGSVAVAVVPLAEEGKQKQEQEQEQQWEQEELELADCLDHFDRLHSDKEFQILSELNQAHLTFGKDRHYVPDEDFNLTVKIGQGAFSEVFLGTDVGKNTLLAVKKLSSEDAISKVELDILSDIQHLNIMKLYGVIMHQGIVYMLQEYVDGGDLSQFTEGLPENIALYLFQNVLKGLDYLHTHWSVIHRDIKPDNILFVEESCQVKIADFGLAIHVDDVALDVQRMYPPGTENYMPPETAKGERYFANRDVWSAACLLMMLLTGKIPYYEYRHAPTLLYLIGTRPNGPDVPDELSGCVKSLFASVFVDSASRPSANELLKHKAFESASPEWLFGTAEDEESDDDDHDHDDNNGGNGGGDQTKTLNSYLDHMVIDPSSYDDYPASPAQPLSVFLHIKKVPPEASLPPQDEFSNVPLPYPDVTPSPLISNHPLFPIVEKTPSSSPSVSLPTVEPKSNGEATVFVQKEKPTSTPESASKKRPLFQTASFAIEMSEFAQKCPPSHEKQKSRTDYLKNASPLNQPDGMHSSDEVRSQFFAYESPHQNFAEPNEQTASASLSLASTISLKDAEDIKKFSRQIVPPSTKTNSSTHRRSSSIYHDAPSKRHYHRSKSRPVRTGSRIGDQSGVDVSQVDSRDFMTATTGTETGTFATAPIDIARVPIQSELDSREEKAAGYLQFGSGFGKLEVSKQGRIVVAPEDESHSSKIVLVRPLSSVQLSDYDKEAPVESSGHLHHASPFLAQRPSALPLGLPLPGRMDPSPSTSQQALPGTVRVNFVNEDLTSLVSMRRQETRVGRLAQDPDVQSVIRDRLPGLKTFTLAQSGGGDKTLRRLESDEVLRAGTTVRLVVVGGAGSDRLNIWYIDEAGRMQQTASSPMTIL